MFLIKQNEPEEGQIHPLTVSFARPFLFGMLKEFKHPYVVAGTKLRLKLLESVCIALGILSFLTKM